MPSDCCLRLHAPEPELRPRRHPHQPGRPIDPSATYSVSTWDHEEGDWHREASGVRLMALRPILRDLLGWWDTVSILVERE